MIVRTALGLAGFSVFMLALVWFFGGLPPQSLPSAVAVGNGMGAKLACSGRHLSGFGLDRMVEDAAVYTPLMRSLDYSEPPGPSVRATLYGLAPATARYRPGLGCTLEVGDTSALDAVRVPVQSSLGGASWPMGEAVGPPRADLQVLLDDMLARDNSDGLDTRALLVVHDGQVVAESYAPGIDKDTPLLGWSMGKSVTAILLGRLESMALALGGETDLFPAWSGDERSAISLTDLLQMSSGLDFAEDYIPGSDATKMLFTARSASDVAMASELVHAPGAHFSYSSGTTNLLSRLVFERLGGSVQEQVDFFHTEIAVPLGLVNTVIEPDPSGVYVGSSYVYAPARDWARFGQLMLNGGMFNGQRVLDPEWVERAAMPNKSDNDRRYGYQFWLNAGGEPRWPSVPVDAYSMQGNRKQMVMMVPSRDAVIVRLGWSPGDYPFDANFAAILSALKG